MCWLCAKVRNSGVWRGFKRAESHACGKHLSNEKVTTYNTTKEKCGKIKTENNDWLSNTVSEVRANHAVYCSL